MKRYILAILILAAVGIAQANRPKHCTTDALGQTTCITQ